MDAPCHIPQTLPEQFLWCGRTHCPTEGPMTSWCAGAMGERAWICGVWADSLSQLAST